MDLDKFFKAVTYFEKITTNSQIIDSSIQQSIIYVVISAVIIAVTAI